MAAAGAVNCAAADSIRARTARQRKVTAVTMATSAPAEFIRGGRLRCGGDHGDGDHVLRGAAAAAVAQRASSHGDMRSAAAVMATATSAPAVALHGHGDRRASGHGDRGGRQRGVNHGDMRSAPARFFARAPG